MVLYLLTNAVNLKRYVGITARDVQDRWASHVKAANRNAQYAISRAIRKYGVEQFAVTILAESDSWEDLCRMEQEAIVTYNTHVVDGHGYNMTRGGDGRLGLRLSEEAKATIGRKNKERVRSPEELARLAAHVLRGDDHYWRKNTPPPGMLAALKEGHARWRAAGGKLSEEGRRKQAATITGHTVSAETREKIAAKLRGNVIPADVRQKISASLQGRPTWNAGKPSSKRAQELATRPVLRDVDNKRARAIAIGADVYDSIKAACIATGFSRATLHKWLLNGKARYLEDAP